MTLAELRQGGPDTDDALYILRDRDGDYVESVESTGRETVKLHFAFTKERESAKVFTAADLWWKQAVSPIGVLFACGFSGGRAIPLRRE